jgi:Trk-type K+ transport system membrane component
MTGGIPIIKYGVPGIALMFDLLVGRLELYTVFVLMMPDFWRK